MSDAMGVATELGEDIGRLINVAKTPGDDAAVLIGEEIEALTEDDAKALLLGCVLILMDRL